jgi:hypothetical protein
MLPPPEQGSPYDYVDPAAANPDWQATQIGWQAATALFGTILPQFIFDMYATQGVLV